MNGDRLDLARSNDHCVGVEQLDPVGCRGADLDRTRKLEASVVALLDLRVELQQSAVQVRSVAKSKAKMDNAVRVPEES